MQDGEQGARHGDEGQQALGEVGDALLDNVGSAEGEALRAVWAGAVARVGVHDLGDTEGFGVEGGLRDEAVGVGQTEESGYAGG